MANRGSEAIDEAVALVQEFSEAEAQYDWSKKTAFKTCNHRWLVNVHIRMGANS